jgi:hypothetical protein
MAYSNTKNILSIENFQLILLFLFLVNSIDTTNLPDLIEESSNEINCIMNKLSILISSF